MLAVPSSDNWSGVEKPTPQSACEHGGTARHVPCSTSAEGWWVIDALRCVQKASVLYQLDHFQGLRRRFLHLQTCPQQLFSWKDIWPSSKITETGGICLESPECKQQLAPTFPFSAVLNLSAQCRGWHHLDAGG